MLYSFLSYVAFFFFIIDSHAFKNNGFNFLKSLFCFVLKFFVVIFKHCLQLQL